MDPSQLSYPVIVIPGITASYLQDEYTLPPEIVWSVLTKEYERAALHPDALQYEAAEPARVVRGQIFEVAYRELVEELRHNLSRSADRPVPVYPFAYDWRLPLEIVQAQLDAFIEEVIARTRLIRYYDAAGYAKDARVNLVGHSMGGLIIAGYLASQGAKKRVAKVATLATPFRGSFEVPVKVTTGTANLGGTTPSSREREAARLTPALYYLTPSLGTGVAVPPGMPADLFDRAVWQQSIIDSIAEFIRLHGLTPDNAATQAPLVLDTMLNAAKQHRGSVENLKLDKAGLSAAEWLCVVGVDSDTRVRLQVILKNGLPYFNITKDDIKNDWTPFGNGIATGDGTVPFAGAENGFLKRENLVCVTPDDFGYWELVDKGLARLSGFHGILPNMDMLHRMIVAHFTNSARRDNIWGRPAPGVTKEQWRPAVPNLPPK